MELWCVIAIIVDRSNDRRCTSSGNEHTTANVIHSISKPDLIDGEIVNHWKIVLVLSSEPFFHCIEAEFLVVEFFHTFTNFVDVRCIITDDYNHWGR